MDVGIARLLTFAPDAARENSRANRRAFPGWRNVLRARSCPAWFLPAFASSRHCAGKLILTRAAVRRNAWPTPCARPCRWHGSGESSRRERPLCPNSGQRRARFAQNATARRPMNIQPSYTLASPPQSSRLLRGWAMLSRGTFSGAIFLIDVALIVAMSLPHRHRLLPRGLWRHRRHVAPSFRSACWRPASSPSPTCSAANTGCRTSSPSSRTPAAPSNCGT